MPDGKIPFDSQSPDLAAVRQIVFERLRRDPQYRQLDNTGDGFAPFVEYVGATEPDRQNGRRVLMFLAREVFWELVVAGMVSPGMDSHNLELPWFHITRYGGQVLASTDCASRKLDPCLKHGASSVFLPVPEVSNPFSQTQFL